MGDAVRISEPQVVARAGASGRVVGICIGPEASQVSCPGLLVRNVLTARCARPSLGSARMDPTSGPQLAGALRG
jgi:hypothetical protein